MEASSSGKRAGGGRSLKDVTSTRQGSLMLALGAAILAGILLLLFVQHYRDDANKKGAATSVFVAKSLIPHGSSAEVIASNNLLERTSLRGSQVQSGAISDPSEIAGKVALVDIAPGQQIKASDFGVAGDGIGYKLTGTDRAIAVPVDSTHGLVGQVRAGDHVDVLAGISGAGGGAARPTIRTLLQNIEVLQAAGSGGGGLGGGSNGGANVILRATDKEALLLAFVADNGKIWLTLRPPAGAKETAPAAVSIDSLTTRTASGG